MMDHGGSSADYDQRYAYLGTSTIVQANDANATNSQAPQLSYVHATGDTVASSDGGDQYTGLDRFGRVIDQRWDHAVTGGRQVLDRFIYGYDRDNNVLYKNNRFNSAFSELYHANSSSSGDNNAAYDNLNRLQAFQRGTLSASGNNGSTGLDTVSTLNSLSNSSQTWSLDAVGNMSGVTTDGTGQTNTFNSQNQETAAGPNTLSFDNNGNTTTDDHGYQLVFDAWNRLVSVKNGGTTLATYSYDAGGNRIQQTESSTSTDFYFSSAGQVLEERQSSTVTNQYVWGLMYVNQLVLRDDNSTSGSLGKSSSGLGHRMYVLQDADWNITSLFSTGFVRERFTYTPYGTRTVLTGSFGSTTDSFNWVYGFQGGRLDPVSGLVHFAGRDFSPSLMRWVQHDPTGYRGTLNLYQAMNDSPIRFVDPTGTDGFDPFQPPSDSRDVYAGVPTAFGLPPALAADLAKLAADLAKHNSGKRPGQDGDGGSGFYPYGPPNWDPSPTQSTGPHFSGGLGQGGGKGDARFTIKCPLEKPNLNLYFQLDAGLGLGNGRPFDHYYAIGAFLGGGSPLGPGPIWGIGVGIAGDPDRKDGKPQIIGGIDFFRKW